jgi:hypothetical protein
VLYKLCTKGIGIKKILPLITLGTCESVKYLYHGNQKHLVALSAKENFKMSQNYSKQIIARNSKLLISDTRLTNFHSGAMLDNYNSMKTQ